MSKLILEGVFPPMVTPFAADETLDVDAHIHNVQKWNKVQLGGYVVLGSNSEAVYLHESEKLELIEQTVVHATRGRTIIVGTGLESTRETIRFTNEAARKGAHAALVVTPHYYGARMTDAALIQHYTRLADRSMIPVLIYNVSKFTHINMSPAVLEKLAQHPNIIGMKDSSGSIPLLMQYQQLTDADFHLMAGSASIWYPALSLGVTSAVMALANCAPQQCVEVQETYKQGNIKKAERLYRSLFPVNHAVTAKFGIAGLKYACDLCGYQAGFVRSPLQPLNPMDKKQIENMLKSAGLFSQNEEISG